MNDVTVFSCPECGLWMSRMQRVACGDEDRGWTETRCWDCGHRFGVWSERGQLDLGITRQDPPRDNALDVFFERFTEIHNQGVYWAKGEEP